jgi:hypothetical protein
MPVWCRRHTTPKTDPEEKVSHMLKGSRVTQHGAQTMAHESVDLAFSPMPESAMLFCAEMRAEIAELIYSRL